MNIGQCSICLGGFSVAQMGVLSECMHTFHHVCIARVVRERGECPLCRRQTSLHQVIQTPQNNAGASSQVPSDLPNKALGIALDYYDRIARQQPNEESLNKEQREQLELCLNGLLSTIEDQELEREERWYRLKEFLKIAGMAAIGAVLAFLFTLYWPVIVPMAGRLVGVIWSLITGLRDLMSAYWPELLIGGLALTSLLDVVEQAQVVEPEQPARAFYP